MPKLCLCSFAASSGVIHAAPWCPWVGNAKMHEEASHCHLLLQAFGVLAFAHQELPFDAAFSQVHSSAFPALEPCEQSIT